MLNRFLFEKYRHRIICRVGAEMTIVFEHVMQMVCISLCESWKQYNIEDKK